MSTSQIVGAVAGIAVGYFSGSPQLGFATYSAVSGVGAYLEAPDNIGPRLEDLKTQMSSYGAAIPFEWGVNRHTGTIMWPRELIAVEHEHAESAKGGPDNVTFTYTLSCAVLVCEGPIAGIRRIWANKKIVYDVSADNTGPTQDPVIGSMRIHLGTEEQVADPLIEATDGPSPAYRGHAYVVFENYDVTELNGRPPQWEFEVVVDGTVAPDEPPEQFGTFVHSYNGPGASVLDPETGYLWVVNGSYTSTAEQTGGAQDGPCINVYDLATKELVTIISSGTDSGTIGETEYQFRTYGDLAYNPERRTIFAGSGTTIGTYAWHEFMTETMTLRKDGLASEGAVSYGGGTLNGVAYASNGLMLSLSSGFFGGAVTYFNADSGAFMKLNSTRLIGGVSTALPLADTRIALAAGVGLLIVTPSGFESVWFDGGDTFPDASDGNFALASLALDTSRSRLLWSVGHRVVGIDVSDPSGGLVTPVEVFASPAGSGNAVGAVAWDPRSDLYYVTAQGSLFEVDPGSLDITNSIALTGVLQPTDITISPVEGEIILTAFGSVWSLQIGNPLSPEQVTLASIVSALCVRAGLTTADIDVTDLTDLVDGYIVPRQMSARAAIEPLQQTYYFDPVESDDKIKFVKRGAGIAATIAESERAAHEFGQAMPDALSIVRAFEFELPVQCDVEYPDVNADHLVGNQYARRITKDTKQKINLQLPIVMPNTKAKQVAAVNLYQAWLNQTYRWTTTRQYAHLEPTDVVLLPTTSAVYAARIVTKREQPNGVIEWEGRMEDQAIYSQSGEGAGVTNYAPQTIYAPQATVLELMDIPLMRDQDAGLGFYVAMTGGATLALASSVYVPAPSPSPSTDYPVGLSAELFLPMDWSDEFDGDDIDTATWNTSIWYESDTGPQNWKVEGGALYIWPDAGYVDRTLTTDGKVSFSVGSYFEIEAKLPIGACFPAYWLFNRTTSPNKEIDIMEAGFDAPGYYGEVGAGTWHPTDYVCTMWPDSPGYTSGNVRMAGGTSSVLPHLDLSAAFHKYGCMWKADVCDFYFDGVLVGSVSTDDNMSDDMFFLIDLWFNSTGNHAAIPPADTGNTPQGEANSFITKYVRHWTLA